MEFEPLSDQTITERLAVYHRLGTMTAAAMELGIARSTMSNTINVAKARGLLQEREKVRVSSTPLPPDDLPIADIIELQTRRFERRHANAEARKWRPIRLDTDKPVTIAFVGDPHLDDDGCNWPLLRQHVELMQRPDVLAINIGDTTNNWTGRLMRLYAKQETGLKTARKLADWFMKDAGVNWLLWLVGNHDEWEHGAEILSRMNTDKIVMENWMAQVRLVFSNGFEVPLWCSHDFAGHSQWNKLHGPMKAAMMGGGAGIYACGHRHCWAQHVEEVADTGEIFHVLRARGYKFMDDYARVRGYAENQLGATMAAVIDPKAQSQAEAITTFNDLGKAVRYMEAL